MEEKPKTWGGKRREGVTQKPYSFKLDLDLVELINAVPNKNRFINNAIREALKNN